MEKHDTIETTFVEKKAETVLKQGYAEAEVLLQDEDKLERLLQRLEMKLKLIPKVGGRLAEIPTMVSMVRSYIRKEYTDIPIGTIIAIISALLYFVSPLDIIPDTIPGVGHLDDAMVIGICLTLVESDVQEYVHWRDKMGKKLDV